MNVLPFSKKTICRAVSEWVKAAIGATDWCSSSFRCLFGRLSMDRFYSRLPNWQLALGNVFASAVWEPVQASSCLGNIWSLKGWMNCKHWLLSWTFFFNMRWKDWNYFKDMYIPCMFIFSDFREVQVDHSVHCQVSKREMQEVPDSWHLPCSQAACSNGDRAF